MPGETAHRAHGGKALGGNESPEGQCVSRADRRVLHYAFDDGSECKTAARRLFQLLLGFLSQPWLEGLGWSFSKSH